MALVNINNCTDHATRNHKWNDEQYSMYSYVLVLSMYKNFYTNQINLFHVLKNINIAVIAIYGMPF